MATSSITRNFVVEGEGNRYRQGCAQEDVGAI